MLISLLGLALYGVVVLAEQIVAPWAQRQDALT
jgi:ABC-type nitrate/sulfonate/bicarbonate transport system permease component